MGSLHRRSVADGLASPQKRRRWSRFTAEASPMVSLHRRSVADGLASPQKRRRCLASPQKRVRLRLHDGNVAARAARSVRRGAISWTLLCRSGCAHVPTPLGAAPSPGAPRLRFCAKASLTSLQKRGNGGAARSTTSAPPFTAEGSRARRRVPPGRRPCASARVRECAGARVRRSPREPADARASAAARRRAAVRAQATRAEP